MAQPNKEEELSVTRLREYLRIDTSQPNPNYDEVRQFYEAYAKELGLEFKSVNLETGLSIEILTWRGSDPTLKSVMLYCHTDVVPSFPDHWTYPPFSAHKDEEGNIYARGAQDMKCVGVQYLEAIRKLSSEGKKFKRDIHVVFGPDEEVGGMKGMNVFTKMEDFDKLNVGFGLDEGIASPEDYYRVFYAERNVWWVEVTCGGQTGHGSQFLTNTAGEKVHKIISSFLAFRDDQERKLQQNPDLTVGDIITVNLTVLQGGVQYNVVPNKFVAGFDVRLPPTVDFAKFENQLKQWCEEAGPDVTLKFIHKTVCTEMSKTDESSPWWQAFQGACDQVGIKLKKEIFPAGTDARYLRSKGIDVLGFSPMNRTPVLLHDHDEYLNENVFLQGLNIYCHIIPALASVN